MNRNQIEVLRFLLENANSPDVIHAIRWAKSYRERRIRWICEAYGKDEAGGIEHVGSPQCLIQRVGSIDLLCYAFIRDIAEQTGLSVSAVRYAIKKHRKTGIIESEQMWQRDPRQEITEECPKLVWEAAAQRLNYETECYNPGANIYRILAPADEWHYVNFGEQLTLPFPPNETTIIAYRARLRDPLSVSFEDRG